MNKNNQSKPVFIFHGIPGSGKSLMAAIIALSFDSIILSTDAYYIALGYNITAAHNPDNSSRAYQAAVNDALIHLQKQSVILDCTSRSAVIRQSAREQFMAVGHPVIFIICTTDLSIARQRVSDRIATHPNHILSGIEHFDKIVKTFEPLSEIELSSSIHLDTNYHDIKIIDFRAKDDTDKQTILDLIKILNETKTTD